MRVHGGFAFAMYYHLQQLSNNNNNNSLGTFCFATRILYLYVLKIIINLWCSASSSLMRQNGTLLFFFVLLLRLRLSRQRRRLFLVIQSVGSSSRPVLFSKNVRFTHGTLPFAFAQSKSIFTKIMRCCRVLFIARCSSC